MLSTCSSCSGFLPPAHSRCPNCGAEARSPGAGVFRGAFVAATGGVTALTLMACYGLPPCDKDPTACVVDTTSTTGTTGTTGTGGSGGATTGTGVGGGTTAGTGGAGGGTACVSCGDIATKLGTDSATVCAATKAAYEALVACACTSSCSAECGPNTCMGKEISAECQTCLDTSCKTEETACQAK